MGLKSRVRLPTTEIEKNRFAGLRWIGEAEGGKKTPDNEFPEVARRVVPAVRLVCDTVEMEVGGGGTGV